MIVTEKTLSESIKGLGLCPVDTGGGGVSCKAAEPVSYGGPSLRVTAASRCSTSPNLEVCVPCTEPDSWSTELSCIER